jgi:hypothetical protein
VCHRRRNDVPTGGGRGCWYRVRLVWPTTDFTTAGHAALACDAARRGAAGDASHHPDIVLSALAVHGFVVARQVKHIGALSSSHGHRAPP